MDYLPKGNEDGALTYPIPVASSSEMDYLPKGNEDVASSLGHGGKHPVRNGLFAERQ